MRHFILIFALFAAAPAAAQQSTNVEIVFWESIRNSTDPADFRAYLEQFPKGSFAALARNRLAALEGSPAAAPKPAAGIPAPAALGDKRLPQAGDSWSYRLYEPQRLDGPKERTYSVKVSSVSPTAITEQYAVEGGAAGEWTHQGSIRQVVTLGRSVFAPYLIAFGEVPVGDIGRVPTIDPACGSTYVCEAQARVVAWEKITVPAGTFDTVKVEVRQNWRAAMMRDQTAAQMQGGRTLLAWYAPAAKRAVKFSSRPTFGTLPPIDTNFDLELVSYQLK